MRVLVTLPWGRRLGGAEAMLQAVLDGAHEAGHEFELVFFENGPWPTELIEAGFRVEVILAGQLRHVHRWLRTIVRLSAIMRRRKPDLILNWAAKTQLYGAPAAMLAGMGRRVVWWQQGIPDGFWLDRWATRLPARAIGCYSRSAARAQEQLTPPRETFVVAAGAPAPMPTSAAPALADTSALTDISAPTSGPTPTLNGHRLACAPTPNGHQPAPALAGASALTDISAPTGVPAPTPNGHRPTHEHSPSPDRPVVGIVGRLQPWKGQDRLLRAQALLRGRGHDVHLMIVGGDAYGLSPEYAASLPLLAERLGLAGDVTMTGQVPDAGPYIERMDALVNASDPEPFGIVLLEAMARGVPVVAVNSGGPSEFIEHGRTGVLARSSEPEALADALELLLGSRELRRTIARAGRERFYEEFTDVALRKRFFAHLELLADNGDMRRVDEPAAV